MIFFLASLTLLLTFSSMISFKIGAETLFSFSRSALTSLPIFDSFEFRIDADRVAEAMAWRRVDLYCLKTREVRRGTKAWRMFAVLVTIRLEMRAEGSVLDVS